MTKTAELLQEATENQKQRTIETYPTRFTPLGSPKSYLAQVPETRFGLTTAATTKGRNLLISTTNSRDVTTQQNGKRTFASGGAVSEFDVLSNTFNKVAIKTGFGFMTARNQSQRHNKTAYNTSKPSLKKEIKIEEEDQVLNMVNKCQMFQIAATRMNS